MFFDHKKEFNRAAIIQQGDGNLGFVKSTGSSNEAYITQVGNNNFAQVDQMSNSNVARYTVAGSDNTFRATQKGKEGHIMDFDLSQSQTTGNNSNYIYASQRGRDQRMWVTIKGSNTNSPDFQLHQRKNGNTIQAMIDHPKNHTYPCTGHQRRPCHRYTNQPSHDLVIRVAEEEKEKPFYKGYQ